MRKHKFDKGSASIILTCLGGIGLVATTITAIKATPKALKLIEEAEKEKGEELSKWEKVKTTTLVYIPTIITGAATLTCFMGATIISQKQQASLTSAYMLLDQNYKKYRQKVVELYGPETHNKIVEAIAVEEAHDVYPYVQSGWGCYAQYLEDDYSEPRLFYDAYGHRYFNVPLEQVLQAEYHLNRIFVTEGGCIDLNTFYEYLGLDPTDYGEKVGWNICTIEEYWIDFNHRKITLDDGLECYVVETVYEPTVEALSEEYE
nr:DUF6353 family protein [uncultured Mediterraneibacter sp.]